MRRAGLARPPAAARLAPTALAVTPDKLDDFIVESDRRGGPGSPDCEAYWKDFVYAPTVSVDESLDPYGEEYAAAQVRLYTEISGRGLDQQTNELHHFDIEAAASAPNAYNHPHPSELARHYQILAKVARNAGLPHGSDVLDMGCGWGLSSEIMAQMGFKVTAVDINPLFVELVGRRAQRLGYPISTVRASFDGFESERKYGLILFYECLHHAVRPWQVIEKLTRSLAANGVLCLAGEPINCYWWKHWGLRLDALSVYCIRKYGWFESGWSQEFILDVLQRSGLTVRVIVDADAGIGPIVSGSVRDVLFAADLAASAEAAEWDVADRYLISKGRSRLRFCSAAGVKDAVLKLNCFRPKPLSLVIVAGGEKISVKLMPGENHITVPIAGSSVDLEFVSETWVPDDEIANGDKRSLAFHFESMHLISQKMMAS